MADDRHDGMEELDPGVLNDEEPNDPAAAAFEALRATVETLAIDLTREMMTIRKGVDFALDQIEKRGTPVDYSVELGRINQNQAETNEHLLGIEQSKPQPSSMVRSIMPACSSAAARAWSGPPRSRSSGARPNWSEPGETCQRMSPVHGSGIGKIDGS